MMIIVHILTILDLKITDKIIYSLQILSFWWEKIKTLKERAMDSETAKLLVTKFDPSVPCTDPGKVVSSFLFYLC